MPHKTHRCDYCGDCLPTSRGLRSHISQKPACSRQQNDALDLLYFQSIQRRWANIHPPTAPAVSTSARRKTTWRQAAAPSLPATDTTARPPSPKPQRGQKRSLPNDLLPEGQPSPKRIRSDTVPRQQTPSPPQTPTILPTPACKPPHSWIHEEAHTDPTAGGVLRWERLEDQSSPQYNPIWERKEIFEKGEWLGNVHVSDSDRDAYFKQKKDPIIPWETVREFNRDVDRLPHGPEWSKVVVRTPEGELLDMYMRDPLEIVKYLISRRRFAKHMRYAPVRHWTSKKKKKRLYSEIWTGDWWWRLQNTLGCGRGATIAPIIISSDKTHLSLMRGNKQAWPVYITIGNISKSIRRKPSKHATVLLGYVPVTDLTGEAGWQFFHDCVATMLQPLQEPVGTSGVEMQCADGGVRLVFPVVAAYIADFAEQTLVACSRENRCPICLVPADERQDGRSEHPVRDKVQARTALDNYKHQKRGAAQDLKDLGLRPTQPFWQNLPFVNLSDSITPDLLHQIHQGVFGEHLDKWLTNLIGEERFDAWLTGLPRAPGMRHFTDGKSRISQWTGSESKALAQVFMSVAAGCDEAKAVGAARHIVNFMYRAHLSQMSDDDLEALDEDQIGFHDLKDIFIKAGAYRSKEGHFNRISKLHMLSHYVRSIRELGTPDNFNTEATERLHIEYVKDGWRASNHVNEIPQMVKYLQRRESWALLRTHLSSIGVLPAEPGSSSLDDEPEQDKDLVDNLPGKDGGCFETVGRADSEPKSEDKWRDELIWHLKPLVSTASDHAHAKYPGSYLIDTHGAEHILEATRKFLYAHTGSNSRRPLDTTHNFLVWPRCKLEHGRIPFLPLDIPCVETVRAAPASFDEHDRLTHYPMFDTALFLANPNAQGLQRYAAGRVRAIFKLPKHLQFLYSKKLVYVEHFRSFSVNPGLPHGFHTTTHQMERGRPSVRQVSVIPLSTIRMACHLTPVYQLTDQLALISSSSDLLTSYQRFYLNGYSSYFIFNLLDHWRKQLAGDDKS
ncbi:hypothetical protein FRC09_017655 [Ceratobasidium sp. 395]|nr:hypothetical protein FRC09_017655 [Ceratobasidium sp. 395]